MLRQNPHVPYSLVMRLIHRSTHTLHHAHVRIAKLRKCNGIVGTLWELIDFITAVSLVVLLTDVKALLRE